MFFTLNISESNDFFFLFFFSQNLEVMHVDAVFQHF